MKLKIGFIGLGGIARAHMEALTHIEGVQITAVYDTDSVHAHKTAHSLNAKAYGSSMEMVESGSIDVLFICSPQFARDETEMLAARKGIHLLVEKPLGLDLQKVIHKEQIIRDSGVIHSSGYCLRYLDTVQKAKSYLEGKQIDMVLAYRLGGLHTAAWWNRLEQSGGQLVDQTTHQVDLIRYLAGEIDEVYAQFERRAILADDPQATIYDVGTMTLRLESGAVGSVANSCTLPRLSRSEVEITGRNFYLQINGNSLRILDGEQDTTEISPMNFHQEQDRRFIEAIRAGSQDLVLGSYTEALKTLAVTLAANESAGRRKPMKRVNGTCLYEEIQSNV